MTKILFILKKKQIYSGIEDHDRDISMSTGLYNSANYVCEMINPYVESSDIIVVNDNNDIDREVRKYNPTHVIIEALWVVPEKFEILNKLHPKVKWIIRLHSEVPFIANEGIAMDWIGRYLSYKNVSIGINAPRMLKSVRDYLNAKPGFLSKDEIFRRTIYMPNYYPYADFKKFEWKKETDTIKIGCFGAVRPLKNQLAQALSAVTFAEKIGKKLEFHMNSSRVEMQGSPGLKNIVQMFEQLEPKHKLVLHTWMPRKEFLNVVGKMDISMQSSFSETFNIVSADAVSQAVPILGTKEMPWQYLGISDPTSPYSIEKQLEIIWALPKLNVLANQFGLKAYSKQTEKIWKMVFAPDSEWKYCLWK